MKKRIIAIFMALSLSAAPVAALAADDDIKVMLDGERIAFDVQPQIIDERTMVPLRAIFEALGASVDRDQETQTVTAVKGDTKIALTIGKNVIYVNDEPIELDVAPLIIDERTLVPVRAIAESFGLDVGWDGENATVIIKSVVEKIANAAYEKLVESIKKEAEHDEATGVYTYKLPALMQKSLGLAGIDTEARYTDPDGVITLIVGKTEDNMTTAYTLSTDRNLSAKLDVKCTSADGKTEYGITGEYAGGKLNITGSNLDEAMYAAVMSEYEEVYGTVSKIMALIGVSLTDLGF